MKNKIYSAALAACALATVTSCSLDEYNPSEIDDEVLTTYDGLYGLEAKCYEPIYGQLYTVFDFMSMAECGTDIWWCQNDKTNTEQLFYYEGLAPFESKGWDKAFMQIYSALDKCNSVIANADNVETTSTNEDNVKTLVAEAHFLRGYYHLLLTTYYGPITLVTSVPDPSSALDLTAHRNTLTEIYTSITEDLQYAAENLPVTALESNRARATKKAAQGMLCRAYIQGAGQGLKENGVSYWKRAKEEAEKMIDDPSAYGAELYSDVDDLWADANNRKNKEALFVAGGIDACSDQNTYNYENPTNNKLFTYCYFGLSNFSDLNKISNDKSNYLYGRVNNNLLAPSYYLVHCFNPTWDKRWENSFQTAFGSFSCEAWSMTYNNYSVLWTPALVEKYGLDFDTMFEKVDYTTAIGKQLGIDESVFVASDGKWASYSKGFPDLGYGYAVNESAYPRKQLLKCQYLRPYANIGKYSINNYTYGGNQYTAYVWPKTIGKTDANGNFATAKIDSLVTPKKVYNISYPMDPSDNRFYMYLYNPNDTIDYSTKEGYHYSLMDIDDLFCANSSYDTPSDKAGNPNGLNAYYSEKSIPSSLYKACPCLNKFNWSYDGVFYGGNLQIKNGDIMIMRFAEIYLIAAEASQKLGNTADAAKYLNVLRKRAARSTASESDYMLESSDITENVIFDEYARELCGEFTRWALLQRHDALKTRLAMYNTRASMSFKKYMKWRPISLTFLNQINNKEEYGDNGYGATTDSGLTGYEE